MVLIIIQMDYKMEMGKVDGAGICSAENMGKKSHLILFSPFS